MERQLAREAKTILSDGRELVRSAGRRLRFQAVEARAKEQIHKEARQAEREDDRECKCHSARLLGPWGEKFFRAHQLPRGARFSWRRRYHRRRNKLLISSRS